MDQARLRTFLEYLLPPKFTSQAFHSLIRGKIARVNHTWRTSWISLTRCHSLVESLYDLYRDWSLFTSGTSEESSARLTKSSMPCESSWEILHIYIYKNITGWMRIHRSRTLHQEPQRVLQKGRSSRVSQLSAWLQHFWKNALACDERRTWDIRLLRYIVG